MTVEEKQRLRSDSLLELHDAVADENAHKAKLEDLVQSLGSLVDAHGSGRLKTVVDARGYIAVGSDKPIQPPTRDAIYDAVRSMELAKDRVDKARQKCKNLGLHLEHLSPKERT